jgi:hypothetical protein
MDFGRVAEGLYVGPVFAVVDHPAERLGPPTETFSLTSYASSTIPPNVSVASAGTSKSW